MSYNVVQNAILSIIVFLPYWAISKQAFPRLCDTGQSLQPIAKEHFTNPKLLTQLKPTAYLGF